MSVCSLLHSFSTATSKPEAAACQKLLDKQYFMQKQNNYSRLKRHQSDLKENHFLLVSYVILSLLIFSSLIECKSLNKSEGAKKNLNSGNGIPCICNATFFESCPNENTCKENMMEYYQEKSRDFVDGKFGPEDENLGYSSVYGLSARERASIDRLIEDNLAKFDDLGDLGNFHPDHPDTDFDGNESIGNKLGPHGRPNSWTKTAKLSPYDQDRISRNRNRYLASLTEEVPTIKPISITIPLKFPDLGEPKSKPIFQYRKTTSYIGKPEVQLIPVTKTIIRPENLTNDQIIDQDGHKVSKNFDVKKL